MTMEVTSVQKAQEVSAMLAAPGSRILAGGTGIPAGSEDILQLVDISGIEGTSLRNMDGVQLRKK